MFIEVALPVPLNKNFVYRLDKSIDEIVGKRVRVPFGKSEAIGYVVNILSQCPIEKIKDVISVIDEKRVLPDELLKLGYWLSEHYYCSLGETLNIIFPAYGNIVRTDTDTSKYFSAKYARRPNNISKPQGTPSIEQLPLPVFTLLPEFSKIEKLLHKKQKGIFTIYGLSIKKCLEKLISIVGSSIAYGEVILLIPETFSTEAIFAQFQNTFGNIALMWHYGVKDRYLYWQEILDGRVKIIIGTRSAIFTPFKNLCLIIIFDEVDSSYKELRRPMYTTLTVALKRAELNNAVLLLTGAIPGITTYYNLQKKAYKSLVKENKLLLPKISIVDLHKSRSIYTKYLQEALTQRLSRNERSIVFINRKGYAKIILCRKCGWKALCSNCKVHMSYYFNEKKLKCHYCHQIIKFDGTCPTCGGKKLYLSSRGTQRVASELAAIFPQARISRLDSDIPEVELKKILQDLDKIDILIGTQIILSRWPLTLSFKRKLTLIALLDIDLNLFQPTLNAFEQTLIFVAHILDLLDRDKYSELLLQTHHPKHYFFRKITTLDYKSLYKKELSIRKELKYFPYGYLASITLRDKNKIAVSKETTRLIEFLSNRGLDLFGPISEQKLGKTCCEKVFVKFSASPEISLNCLKEYQISAGVHMSIDIEE